jgi:hypothetical protein
VVVVVVVALVLVFCVFRPFDSTVHSKMEMRADSDCDTPAGLVMDPSLTSSFGCVQFFSGSSSSSTFGFHSGDPTTDLGKKVMADGKVTTDEVIEVKSAYTACLTAAGMKVKAFSSGIPTLDYGTSDTSELSQRKAAASGCVESSDWSVIYYQYTNQNG